MPEREASGKNKEKKISTEFWDKKRKLKWKEKLDF